jgi:hypothetical protein
MSIFTVCTRPSAISAAHIHGMSGRRSSYQVAAVPVLLTRSSRGSGITSAGEAKEEGSQSAVRARSPPTLIERSNVLRCTSTPMTRAMAHDATAASAAIRQRSDRQFSSSRTSAP